MFAAMLAGIASFSAPLRAQAPPIDQAAAAYGVYDIGRAESLYEAVADDPGSSDRDRAVARRELARIAWLVDAEAVRARRLLSASIPEDPDPCPAARLLARVLNDGNAPVEAPAWLDPLATRCLAIEPGVAIERIRSLAHQAAVLSGREQAGVVGGALHAYRTLPVDVRSSPDASRLLLTLGLLSGDPATALEGWRGYFGLPEGETLPEALRGPDLDGRRIFEGGLAVDASPNARLDLAVLLMRAGFHEDLRRFVAAGGIDSRRLAGDERARTVTAYLHLVERLQTTIAAHDRYYARHGERDEDGYEARLRELLREAVAALGDRSEDPWPALRRHFNLYGVIGKSNGVSGIHLGHVITDERTRVAQGARSGSLRFVAIDNMIHNSFSGWLADGASGPGGWASDGATIVQVRPRYLSVVETALSWAQPGEARERALREMEAKRQSDRAIARSEPIAYLPGVRDRLRLQGIDDIAERVREEIENPADFAPAFRRAFSAAVFGSSITAHEGRHVLDQLEFSGDAALPNPELEYRAKLSELAMAASPKLALSSIYSPLFGGTSGHGIANRRLAEALADWVDAHSEQVEGYDPQLTALEQIDRLTNDQLRSIARSLDPAEQPAS